MTALAVLAVIGLVQGVFLVLLMIFLGVRQQVHRIHAISVDATLSGLYEPLGAWLSGTGSVQDFVAALRYLPGRSALGVAGNLARTAIPDDYRTELALALRDEPWVRRAIAHAASPQWGHRLEAARCLALAGIPADARVLEALLNDARPAVAIAAITALPRVADAALVARVLDRLGTLPGTVVRYLHGSLRELRTVVEPALVTRLVADASPRALASWATLAGVLELPLALERVAQLAHHPDAHVREAVAQAIRRVPRKRSADILLEMLHDADADVRAAAAHGLGELASGAAIPALMEVVHDESWAVRFRATLALTQLGEPGRTAVRALRSDVDPYVADMATLIAGLGDGALLDMVEG